MCRAVAPEATAPLAVLLAVCGCNGCRVAGQWGHDGAMMGTWILSWVCMVAAVGPAAGMYGRSSWPCQLMLVSDAAD